MNPDQTSTEETADAAKAPEAPPEPSPLRKWLPRPQTLVIACTAFLLSAVLGTLLLTAERPLSGAGQGSGTAGIGGHFELVDHTGRTVTEADFAGKYMLVYFGFTFCPDVCPTALQVMSGALDKLGDKAGKVQPVFITIDPERDTPENMAAYVNHFHERLVGLTGTPEQVRRAANAYKVVFRKVQKAGDADYVMEHTGYMFLMGPDGKYQAHFDETASPEAVAQTIAAALGKNP